MSVKISIYVIVQCDSISKVSVLVSYFIYHVNIYLRSCNIGRFLHWLNSSIKVSVERWPHCHVRYCFINSFSTGPNNFANNVFIQLRNVFKYFFTKTHLTFYSCDGRFSYIHTLLRIGATALLPYATVKYQPPNLKPLAASLRLCSL